MDFSPVLDVRLFNLSCDPPQLCITMYAGQMLGNITQGWHTGSEGYYRGKLQASRYIKRFPDGTNEKCK